MKAMKLAALIVAAALLTTGCSDDKSTNSDGGGNGGETQGTYLINAWFGDALAVGGNFTATVVRGDDNDAGANECDFDINGTDIPLIALSSTPTEAVYTKLNFGYEAGTDYTVTVALGSRSATCSFTAPDFQYPEITAPAEDGLFTPGQAFTIAWQYPGTTPDSVFVSVSPTSGEEESIYSARLAGSTTSVQVPAVTTSGWSAYEELLVTVDLGEMAWPFTGDLASIGSFVFNVLPGDAETVTNSGGQPGAEWVGTAYLYPDEIDADGTSTAEITFTIYDDGTPCPDGNTVNFTASPSGYVTISPASVTTLGGSATATITAGTTAGTVTITAMAPDLSGGISDNATLTLGEALVYTFTFGTGTHPSMAWSPADGMVMLVVTLDGNLINVPLWSIIPVGVGQRIQSPVTYGTTPANCQKVYPYLADPDPLNPGTDYRLWLVTSEADTVSGSFTP